MRIKNGSSLRSTSSVDQVLEYHQKTKHQFNKYADGPEFLDWDLQPNPYREFSDTKKIPLTLDLQNINCSYESLYDQQAPTPCLTLNKDSLGILMGLSMGLSAHKEYMGDRWSVRCNPSSGNLHPTEAYVISKNISGLQNGVYHYLSKNHELEQRMLSHHTSNDDSPELHIALSSIYWREAWKYGERAYRYCQLDVGHALAAINYATSCLGWKTHLYQTYSAEDIARLCGIDRKSDFEKAEAESADLLLKVMPDNSSANATAQTDIFNLEGKWFGQANLLDRYPMYRWPVIEQVSDASALIATDKQKNKDPDFPKLTLADESTLAKQLIYRRRSAQHFDKQTHMSQNDFYALLDKCLYRPDTLPWSSLAEVFPMLCLFYVHRVQDLTPGVYLLANTGLPDHTLKKLFQKDMLWQKAEACPEHIPFYLLTSSDAQKFSKQVSCHQGIACDGAFSLSMMFEFEKNIQEQIMNYRKLHWQAGLLGQTLYLEAESYGLQGTGIGCFFDDAIHESFGISDKEYQVLYNFTVGAALNDSRIQTLPVYPRLQMNL